MMYSQLNTYLKFVDFTRLVNWSSYALLGKNLIYTQQYSFVRIGAFLKRNKEQVSIEDSVLYKRPTIRINGNGIDLRNKIEVEGKNIGTKNQFRIHRGQFLLSKIDARNGAFGVVPAELDYGIITGNFWTFDVDYNLINPHYLTLLTGTKEFQKLCQTASVGTTNRNYLQEDLFLNFEIPLPSIAEQVVLLNNYDSKMAEANKLRQKANDIENDIEKYLFDVLGIVELKEFELKKGLNVIEFADLTKWALTHLKKEKENFIEQSKYQTKRIKDLLVFFEGGNTPSKSRADFWNGEIFWTSPKDFNGQYVIEKAEDKITQLAVNETGITVYPKGVFLSVFRSGILQHSFPTAITKIETTINQDLKAYSLKEELIDKYYYLYFVRIFKKYILFRASKKSVTVESINTEDFMEIPIPLPPLIVQKNISDHISNLFSESKELKTLANEYIQIAEQEFEKSIFIR